MKKSGQLSASYPNPVLRGKVETKLEEIYAETSKVCQVFPSLFAGDAGIRLFHFMVHKHLHSSADEEFQNDIQSLAERALAHAAPTFCGGHAGIDWFFHFLCRNGLLTDEDRALVCYRDDELMALGLSMLREGNYDFLHGAIGIGTYLLYGGGQGLEVYFAQFVGLLSALIDTSEKKDSIPFYDVLACASIPGKTNLGLAHGIPAILLFSSQCFHQGICRAESGKLARQIVHYLRTHTNEDTSGSYYSYAITSHDPASTSSRLAWCYGDLGVGIALYRAGIAFEDRELTDFATEVLSNSTKRKTLADAGIADAGICHGASGLAHLYNRIWRSTSSPLFKEACDHWIEKTLELSVHPDGVAGYKRFDPSDNSYHQEYGLLEGAAGIGLVLLSYLSGDLDWDYCLLLND